MVNNSVSKGKELIGLSELQEDRVCRDIIDDTKKLIRFPLELNLNHPFRVELKEALDKKLIGQENAKNHIIDIILGSILRVRPKKGPLGVLFFHGPTGVGKTEVVKAITDLTLGGEDRFIKINCENYQEHHTATNLFGAPKSYIGYDDDAIFTNKNIQKGYIRGEREGGINPMIKRIPYFNIILFDEIEKAHPKIAQQLLGILDEGKCENSKGEDLDFTNSIIIFTSNIGQKEIKENNDRDSIGFISNEENKEIDKNKVLKKSFSEKFSPEFLGRVDNFVEFNNLTTEECREILELQIISLNKQIINYYKESDIKGIVLDQEVYDYLIEKGYSKEKGARELVRTFDKEIEFKLGILFNSKDFSNIFNQEGVIIHIGLNENNEIKFEISTKNNDFIQGENINKKEVKKDEVDMEYLISIYSKINGFVELVNMDLDEDLDFREDIASLKKELLQMGLNDNDIVLLKEKGIIEEFKNLKYLDDFHLINKNDDTIFFPFPNNVIIKIVEKVVKENYSKFKEPYTNLRDCMESSKFFIKKHIIKGEELDNKQNNLLLMLIKKTFNEKLGLDIE